MAGSAQQSRIERRRQTALAEGGAEYSAKRAEITRIAANVFRNKGYARATLNDIAKEFGTDRATIYYYFGSKDEIFQECIRGILDENMLRAEAIVDSEASAREKLLQLLRVLITSQVEHYPYMAVYIQEDMSRVGDDDADWAVDMRTKTRRFDHIVESVMEEGLASGEFHFTSARLATNAFFGMALWMHRWHTPESGMPVDDIVESFGQLILNGLNGAAFASNVPDQATA